MHHGFLQKYEWEEITKIQIRKSSNLDREVVISSDLLKNLVETMSTKVTYANSAQESLRYCLSIQKNNNNNHFDTCYLPTWSIKVDFLNLLKHPALKPVKSCFSVMSEHIKKISKKSESKSSPEPGLSQRPKHGHLNLLRIELIWLSYSKISNK